MNRLVIAIVCFGIMASLCSCSNSGTQEAENQTIGEIIELTHNDLCPGCNEVQVCASPQRKNSKTLTFAAAPNRETKTILGNERLESFISTLDMDTCHILTSEERKHLRPITGVTVLQAGTISILPEWPGWGNEPISLDYSEKTRGYGMTIHYPDKMGINCGPGINMHLQAAGGEDLTAFSNTCKSIEPILLKSPHVDNNGKLNNIDISKPLTVEWTGAGDLETLFISITTQWCNGVENDRLVCHVANDGEFTIPLEYITAIDWSNTAVLTIQGSKKIYLDIAELGGKAFLSLRTTVQLPIFHDPNATQQVPTNCGPMEEGYIGNECRDDSECGGGCCLQEVYPYFADNYCSIANCESDIDCPADSICIQNDTPQLPYDTYCAKICSDDTDCRYPDYHCAPVSEGTSVCVPNYW